MKIKSLPHVLVLLLTTSLAEDGVDGTSSYEWKQMPSKG